MYFNLKYFNFFPCCGQSNVFVLTFYGKLIHDVEEVSMGIVFMVTIQNIYQDA